METDAQKKVHASTSEDFFTCSVHFSAVTTSPPTTTSTTVPPTSTTDPRCPMPSGFGLCVHQCSDNTGCSTGRICCSNGCGMTCVRPVPTSPPPTTTSPPPTTTSTPPTSTRCPVMGGDGFGACVISCSSDSDCTGGRLCCSNGCGQTCITPVTVPTSPPPTTGTVTCRSGGREYRPGETFTASDGCNTW